MIRILKGHAKGDYLTTCTARPIQVLSQPCSLLCEHRVTSCAHAQQGCSLHVCLYDIPEDELVALSARERRLACEEVAAVQDSDGTACACMLFTKLGDER
jgi:hypothetical protein